MIKESNYDFLKRLVQVHKTGIVDKTLSPESDEFCFQSTVSVFLPKDADEMLLCSAKDIVDYFFTTMELEAVLTRDETRAQKGNTIILKPTPDEDFGTRGYRITVDENRILTECAIWADKIAIDEELVRLRSHFAALEAMAELDTPVGRKFDFQLQESSREINTIGSKCQNAEIAKLVVEMKNESEKIREQIQNIE
jgi:hypothetical protein